jgi:hypothetical protein
MLTERNWKEVEQALRVSNPYNYVVIDDFLKPDFCRVLREKLLNHWGWRYKNWASQNLHNTRPNIPEVFLIARDLKLACFELLEEKELIAHWALMYHRNIAGGVHADNAAFTLTLWLTPDEYNLDENTGGLILYDVKRYPEMMPHEHLSYTNSEGFVQQNTRGEKVIINYKYNRAVLFDAWTFHKTDTLNFSQQGIDSYRINLSLAFENITVETQRMGTYFKK